MFFVCELNIQLKKVLITDRLVPFLNEQVRFFVVCEGDKLLCVLKYERDEKSSSWRAFEKNKSSKVS